MSKHLKMAAILAGFAILLGGARICAAQKGKKGNAMPQAPVPAQILSAKKVFIANSGGDESLFETSQYSGGPDRLYNEFYSAMKAWGRYELVSTPAEADLVVEVRLTLIQGKSATNFSAGDPYDSLFSLTVRDVQTHTTLWGLTEHAQSAILQDNRDNNFEKALGAIIVELKRIAGSGPAVAAASK
jgi:hypothetical protein